LNAQMTRNSKRSAEQSLQNSQAVESPTISEDDIFGEDSEIDPDTREEIMGNIQSGINNVTGSINDMAAQMTYEQTMSAITQMEDALEDMEVGREDLVQAMDDLESQMRYSSAYQALAIVQLQSALDLMEKNLELVNKSIAIYELQQKLGMATELNVDTQRVSKVELEKSIADNKEQLDNLKRSLNKLIGRTATTPLEVVPMQLPIAIDAAPEYTGKLVEKFIDGDTKLRDLNRDRVDLKDSVKDGMDSDERQNIDYQVEGIDMQIDTQRQAVADNVKAMLAKINSDGEAYKISRQKYVNEKKNFEIAQKKYELGMISQVQLLQAEATLTQAELTNMQNGYAYYFDWQKYYMAERGIDTSMLP